MSIGSRIKQRRLDLGLTQTELAQRLGLKSKVSISTVENDKEDLTTDRIRKFAEALETTPAYLMGWEETTAFRRRHEFRKAIKQDDNGQWGLEIEAIPTVPKKELDELEKAYVEAIMAAEITKRYGDLLKNKQIQRLLDCAKACDPEQIELAISILSLKKV